MPGREVESGEKPGLVIVAVKGQHLPQAIDKVPEAQRVMESAMLQDVEAGRKTEFELFSGTVIRLGLETGVPVPVNRMLYDTIRAIEQGYPK